MTLLHELLALFFYLVVIVAACELFANAIEKLGAKLEFSAGVTGSIFAGVGTALPESMVAIVAIAGAWAEGGGASSAVAEEVGVGAILGAPFMLSTLAMFIAGAALYKFRRRRVSPALNPERTGFRRDLEFFIFAFSVSFLIAFTPYEWRMLRLFTALLLVLTYFYYVLETIKASEALVEAGHGVEEPKALYISYIFRERMFFVVVQLLFALALIIMGARGFVHGVEGLSNLLGVPVITLSLIIVPIAAELPEKVNSVIWIRSEKDTLAVGNITGAMVFQGSVLPAIGIFLTPWTMNFTVMTSGAISIAAALYLYYLVRRGRGIRPSHLILNGCLYLAFVMMAAVSF